MTSFKKKLNTTFLYICAIASLLTLFVYQLLWRSGTSVVRFDSQASCAIPQIDPHSPAAKFMIEAHGVLEGKPPCIGKTVRFEFEYANQTLFRKEPNSDFWRQHTCCYAPFGAVQTSSLKDFVETPCSPIESDSTPIPSDQYNLDIRCSDRGGAIVYRDQLPLFRTDPTVEAEVESLSAKFGSARLSILLIGLDAQSSQNFIRVMPQSHNYLMQELHAVEFSGFNKIGRGTIENLIGLLTGCSRIEAENESHCRLAWSRFAETGYRTIRFEDLIFMEDRIYPKVTKQDNRSDVHYNFRHYADGIRLAAEAQAEKIEDRFGCVGDRYILDAFAEPIFQVAKTYAQKPYFNFVWFALPAHYSMSNARYMDSPLVNLLSRLQKSALLKRTVLFVLSDHGPWHGAYLTTEAGGYERFMPLLYIVLPKVFTDQNAKPFENMKLNANRLVTQYDVHETLMHLLEYGVKGQRSRDSGQRSAKGQSLFDPVSLTRTCESASIPPEYCICYTRSMISGPEVKVQVQQAVTFALFHINYVLRDFASCAQRTLESIDTAAWLRDEKVNFLEVTFTTLPAQAEFQVTVTFDPKLEIMGQVNRLDLYRDQSMCLSTWENATYARTMCLCQ